MDDRSKKLVPLPRNVKELMAHREAQGGKEYLPDINAHVDELHLIMYGDDNKTPQENERSDKYRRLLTAYYNAAAVEGTMVADDYAAAMMLREFASVEVDGKRRDPFVAGSNLATIVRALRVVMKRWKISRKLRAGSIPVPEDDDNDNGNDNGNEE
jgi:hypothetical protein